MNKQTPVTVISAQDLNDKQKETITKTISSIVTGATVSFSVDPSIIGGLVFQVEDKLIDTSLRKKIDELKQFTQQNIAL